MEGDCSLGRKRLEEEENSNGCTPFLNWLLCAKKNNGGRKRFILPWQYAFLEIQLDIYTGKSITTTTMYLCKEI